VYFCNSSSFRLQVPTGCVSPGRREQSRRNESHWHLSAKGFQTSKESRESALTSREDIGLEREGPSAGTAEPQAGIKIAPFNYYDRRISLRFCGQRKRPFKITVQPCFDLDCFVRKPLYAVRLDHGSQMQRLKSASQKDLPAPVVSVLLLNKPKGFRERHFF